MKLTEDQIKTVQLALLAHSRELAALFKDAVRVVVVSAQEEREREESKPIHQLACCCCGGYTRGRQWWNRDIGYGICIECIAFIRKRGQTEAQIKDYYGIQGVHWGLEEKP